MNPHLPSLNLEHAYLTLCSQNGWREDPQQHAVLKHLQELFERVHVPRSLIAWLRRQSTRGIYLWGAVGRGKTALMDLFYASCTVPKKRVHFHDFMTTFHQKRHLLPRASKDSIDQVITHLLGNVQLLCLDEFQVTNIADAMVLKRIFLALEQKKIAFIVTSNTSPDQLYLHGLNRERFLPFIDWLHHHTQILELTGSNDYRTSFSESSKNPSFFSPHTPEVTQIFTGLFQKLTGVHPEEAAHTCTLSSQTLSCLGYQKGMLYILFEEICHKPLGPPDYLILGQKSHILIVEQIPLFTYSNLDALHRWITLVDIWYDQHHILMLSSAHPLEHMVPKTIAPLAWDRTQSRLHQLNQQSASYIASLA